MVRLTARIPAPPCADVCCDFWRLFFWVVHRQVSDCFEEIVERVRHFRHHLGPFHTFLSFQAPPPSLSLSRGMLY